MQKKSISLPDYTPRRKDLIIENSSRPTTKKLHKKYAKPDVTSFIKKAHQIFAILLPEYLYMCQALA